MNMQPRQGKIEKLSGHLNTLIKLDSITVLSLNEKSFDTVRMVS